MSEEGKTSLASDDAFEEFAKSLESVREAKEALSDDEGSEPVVPETLEQAAYEYAKRYYTEKKRRSISMNEINAYKKLFENGLIKQHGNPPWAGTITVGAAPVVSPARTARSDTYSIDYEAAPKIGWDQVALGTIAGTSATPKVKATYAPAKGWEDDEELAPAKEVIGSTIKMKVKEV